MASFTSEGADVKISLEADEARLLRSLLGEMRQLLEQEAAVEDAVVDRLFPKAYADEADARAFADLVGSELKAGKLGAIGSLDDALGPDGPVDMVVAKSEVDPWLTVLTDLRLAIGTRLDVTEEKMSATLDPTDPEAGGMSVLHWLGWVQESLIEAITNRGGS